MFNYENIKEMKLLNINLLTNIEEILPIYIKLDTGKEWKGGKIKCFNLIDDEVVVIVDEGTEHFEYKIYTFSQKFLYDKTYMEDAKNIINQKIL